MIPITVAYLDVTAVTMIITAISSVSIAVGATAVIMWRKAKKKVTNTLHIDLNANKEVEDELVINTDSNKA